VQRVDVPPILCAYPMPAALHYWTVAAEFEPDAVFVLCPWCRGVHIHAAGEGPRVSFCPHPSAPKTYLIVSVGVLAAETRKELAARLSPEGLSR
jgi:hypothetical protein